MLSAQQVAKQFGARWALENVSVVIEPGDVFCLLGANGAGKSTLLKLWLGLLEPTRGDLRVADATPGSAAAAASLTYLPEQVALYPELSGLENLEFLLSIASSAKAAKHSRSDLRKALEDVGLAREAVDRRVSTYSKGMRQRVGIALASVRRSPAVLLDEPTSGLDPRAADELDALIRRLADDGAAVVMATHDIYRAAHVGSRFGYLSDGRLTDPVEGPISPAELDEFCRASTRVAA